MPFGIRTFRQTKIVPLKNITDFSSPQTVGEHRGKCEGVTCPRLTGSKHPLCAWYKPAITCQWTSLRSLHFVFIHSQCEM